MLFEMTMNDLGGGVKMAYKLMKRIIERGSYDRAATMDKLDAFLAADRLTTAEYQELVAMMQDA